MCGLHCLSAFTTFPTCRGKLKPASWPCVSIAFRHSPRSRPEAALEPEARDVRSPLPFGIHHVPDLSISGMPWARARLSPLPFGIHHVPDASRICRHFNRGSGRLHCLSAFTTFPTFPAVSIKGTGKSVSIAFRHSPRSRHNGLRFYVRATSPSPLPFGIHHVPDP